LGGAGDGWGSHAMWRGVVRLPRALRRWRGRGKGRWARAGAGERVAVDGLVSGRCWVRWVNLCVGAPLPAGRVGLGLACLQSVVASSLACHGWRWRLETDRKPRAAAEMKIGRVRCWVRNFWYLALAECFILNPESICKLRCVYTYSCSFLIIVMVVAVIA